MLWIIILVILLGNDYYTYAKNHAEPINISEAKEEADQDTLKKPLKFELGVVSVYYRDTEDNIVNRYTLSHLFKLENLKATLSYNLTDTRDNIREQKAEAFSLTIYPKYIKTFGLGAGLGFSKIGRGRETNYLTGMVKANLKILNGEVGAELSRDVPAKSAEQIENKIRITTVGLSVLQSLTNRLSLSTTYKHKEYSDENRSNDGLFVLKYATLKYGEKGDFEIVSGYRFRYLDFARQSGGGYFDPDNYLSHEFFTSFYFEYKKLYGYIEPFLGYQSFEKYGSGNHDFVGGAYSTVGLVLTKSISIEVNAEGGNYAVETLGYKYYYLDFRAKISF